ncbi:MAG: hypothetical protein ABS77_11985 [Phenylobacterium sp. SCN 69-14]|nr:MAG: hypothetical protein ABS77_11985 [Phenylobacterium sp. SCN 69-14]
MKGAFSVLIQVAARAQGQGHIAQEFAHRQAVADALDTAIQDVDQAGQQLVVSSKAGVSGFRQQGAADDDFAARFAPALVDRPQGFEPLDAGFQDVEALGVVLDIFERGDVPLLVDSFLARLSQRRLQLGQAIDLVIHIARTPGGRRVSELMRVSGWGVDGYIVHAA